jgi:cell division protein FtsB
MDHTPTPDIASRTRGNRPAPRARAATREPGSGEVPALPPRRRHNPWVRRILVFATCVLMLDALFGDRGLAETRRARRTFQQAEETVKRMKHENAGLREQIRRLKDDPGTIESVARAELGLIKPGEILVVVKDVK